MIVLHLWARYSTLAASFTSVELGLSILLSLFTHLRISHSRLSESLISAISWYEKRSSDVLDLKCESDIAFDSNRESETYYWSTPRLPDCGLSTDKRRARSEGLRTKRNQKIINCIRCAIRIFLKWLFMSDWAWYSYTAETEMESPCKTLEMNSTRRSHARRWRWKSIDTQAWE
jgi:hypothetical protein